MVAIRRGLSRIAGLVPRQQLPQSRYGKLHELQRRIDRSGLFDPAVYLAQQADVRAAGEDPWWHFLSHGLAEGRHFTSPEGLAPALANAQLEFPEARAEFIETAKRVQQQATLSGAKLRDRNARIGVFCSRKGNFYMEEIACLFHLGLQSHGIDAHLRDELANKEEYFDIRIFVAPHEFFYLGDGVSWQSFVPRAGTVLYNVEQAQTQWFCRAFSLLLQAPLVLDINPQTALILRKINPNVIVFMPGYLEATPYTVPQPDISQIALVKGYRFSQRKYDWRIEDSLDDRPIDVLFVGARTPHRDKSLAHLDEISELCRFVCAYREATKPFIDADRNAPAAEMNWVLSQRAKIVLNLHRDWIGYFEWSRMVLRGFWQGAGVVTDAGLPNPVFEAGVHYLEESPRHLGELVRWLLLTDDGRNRLDSTRRAGYQRARELGSMPAALAPVIAAFERLLGY